MVYGYITSIHYSFVLNSIYKLEITKYCEGAKNCHIKQINVTQYSTRHKSKVKFCNKYNNSNKLIIVLMYNTFKTVKKAPTI